MFATAGFLLFCRSSFAQSTPFTGTPVPIPGIIQAENYDLGGEGVAYHDTTTGNSGGLYRNDDVDIETNGAGNYCVSYIRNGEWLKYTVNATNDFMAQVRYSVAQDTGSQSVYVFRVSIDDQTVDVQNAYGGCGWHCWYPLITSLPFNVAAGVHVVRVDIISGNFNLDQFEFMVSTNAVLPYQDVTLSISNRVEDLLARMTTNEKIGQMGAGAAEKINFDGADVRNYLLGSVLNGMGGGAVMLPTNSVAAWCDLTDRAQAYALETRLHIPEIYAIDAVHGHGNVYGATIFPHNVGLGATQDPALIQAIGQATAVEVRATGIHWTYAPEVGIGLDARWGRYQETFDETPNAAGELGAAAILGLQGPYVGASLTNVLACAKHYAGDGGTTWGTGTTGMLDQGDCRTNDAAFRSLFVAPYTNAVSAGVGSVMISLSRWNGTKMHTNKYANTNILKGELGFQGIVIGDWAGTYAANPGNPAQGLVDSINAGMDMVMIPDNLSGWTADMQYAVAVGNISTNRINDAVRRILTTKFKLGLFEHPFADRSLTQYVGCAAHRALARQAVRESMVVLQNKNHLLPLRTDLQRVHVAGKNANNLGYQCGGWTIYWQGGSGNTTIGTTIYAGITQTVSQATQVTFSENGTGAAGANVGIVVVGEEPYAEWYGDATDLSWWLPNYGDLTAINNVRAAGVPVVVVLVTGRPLNIWPDSTNWNAVAATWLPGTEGQGVADVLFGNYYPQGYLPHSWQFSNSQLPCYIGQPNYSPQFPYKWHLGLEPTLGIFAGAGDLQLSWPYNNTGFIVQSTTNLADDASWSDESTTPTHVGNAYQVTLPPTSAREMFYRLRRPQ